MAALPTVMIVSPWDSEQSVRINEMDFDPQEHTLWEEREAQRADSVQVGVPASEPNDPGGADGTIEIVDPHDARRKVVIASEEYDPDVDIKWEERHQHG